MTVVALGNPFDGLTLVGPFADQDEALRWAEFSGDDREWSIVEIEAPS